MHILLVAATVLFAFSSLCRGAEIPAIEELSEKLPGFPDAVLKVYQNEPFYRDHALNLFYNLHNPEIPKIEGLVRARLDDTNEANADREFRRDKGFAYLKGLGVDTREGDGWGNVVMTQRTVRLLNQLNQQLSHYRPSKEETQVAKNWYRYSFQEYLKNEPEANVMDLKDKVVGAIDKYYPRLMDWAPESERQSWPKNKESAKQRATVLFDNHVKFGDMPMDGWWKRIYNRLAYFMRQHKLFRARPELQDYKASTGSRIPNKEVYTTDESK